MSSIVAHENEFQLLFQKFAFTNDIVILILRYQMDPPMWRNVQ